MKALAYSILAPLISVAFFMVSTSFFMSFMSLSMQLDGYHRLLIGAVHSAYYAGLLFGAMVIPSQIRGVGHIRVFTAFAAVATVTMLLIGQVDYPIFWIGCRFVMGTALASIYVVLESWLLGKGTSETHGRLLSFYMITLYLAQGGSQLLLGHVNFYSQEPFLLAGTICALGIVPICLVRVEVPTYVEHESYPCGKLLRCSPLAVAGCIVAGLLLGSMYSFGPNFAVMQEIEPAYFMGLISLGAVVLQWPIGKLSDLFDRRRILIILSIAIALTSSLMIIIDAAELLMLLAFVLGGMMFTVYPLAIAQACDRISQNAVTSVASLLLIAYGAGAMLGPLIVPHFMTLFGPKGLFVFEAANGTLLVVVGVVTAFFRKPVPMDEQVSYQPLPQITSVTYDLDLR